MQLFDAVVAEDLGCDSIGDCVGWGCGLEVREGLGM